MSTGVRLWALLCCCTSVAPLAAGAADTPPASAESVRAETELAGRRELYLVLDPAGGRLDVRARAVTLHTVVVTDAALIAPARLGAAAPSPLVSLPVVLTVLEAPPLPDQQVSAPAVLKPYDPEAEPAAPPAPKPPPPPAAYAVALENGLVLQVGPTVPGRSGAGRLAAAVGDGWRRLLRRPRDLRPGLAVAVAEEDARRLFHLFQPGLPILVAAASPAPEG